jgi:hypothetical protein
MRLTTRLIIFMPILVCLFLGLIWSLLITFVTEAQPNPDAELATTGSSTEIGSDNSPFAVTQFDIVLDAQPFNPVVGLSVAATATVSEIPAPTSTFTPVQVGATSVHCIFDANCEITDNDLAVSFIPPGATGNAFLVSRLWPQGESGTQGEGLYAYLYRIDMSRTVALSSTDCITSMTVDFGPITPLDYNSDSELDYTFVITDSSCCDVIPTSAAQAGTAITFLFETPPICAGFGGPSPSLGDRSFFFGMASTQPHRDVAATLQSSQGQAISVDTRAPRSPDIGFTVDGINPRAPFTTTLNNGMATFSYKGRVNEPQSDSITAWVDITPNNIIDSGEPTDTTTVTWREINICLVGNGIGSATDVIRTITATVFTVPAASLAHCDKDTLGVISPNGVAGEIVGFEVTGGTSEGPRFQTTNSLGQVFFQYRSVRPSQNAGQSIDSEGANHVESTTSPHMIADTDEIRVWVDLDDGLDFDAGNEPFDLEAVPTVITLASFDAERNNDGTITLLWRTAVETDNAGFNLYRAPGRDGPYLKINDQLISGQGTGYGASYSYVDESPGDGTLYYKLEDIDYNGVSTFHGPIEARSGTETTNSYQGQTYLPSIEQ